MNQHPHTLSSLHMQDALNGWALSMYAVLRTTDGGAHWNIVLSFPLQQRRIGGSRGIGYVYGLSDFHSASIASVLNEDADNTSRIFHTSDGGQTWQSAIIDALPLNAPPTFIDAYHGWVLATNHFPGNDPGSTYIGQEIALYRTTNAGQSWHRIASGPATSQLAVTSSDAYGIVPFTAGAKMRFVTATTGYLAGTSHQPGGSSFCWLYLTHDGGMTWQSSHASFPIDALINCPPTFFNAQDGLFPVFTSRNYSPYGTDIYVTHDGGTTWTQTASLSFTVNCDNFLDIHHASGRARQAPHMLYTTSDGWQHWTEVPMHFPTKTIYDFNFISPRIAYALGDDIENRFPFSSMLEPIALLKTTNGGYSWQEVSYSFN